MPTLSKPSSPPGIEDAQACAILHLSEPRMLGIYTPRQIFGDGNCAFRAVSLGLTGSEEFHSLLRLLTVIEIVRHHSHYDHTASGVPFGVTLGLNENDTFEELVNISCTEASDVNMAVLYALSVAIQKPLRTYYPPVRSQDDHAQMYTRTVLGRNVRQSNQSADYVVVMWSQTRKIKAMKMFRPNHFILLSPKQTYGTQWKS